MFMCKYLYICRSSTKSHLVSSAFDNHPNNPSETLNFVTFYFMSCHEEIYSKLREHHKTCICASGSCQRKMQTTDICLFSLLTKSSTCEEPRGEKIKSELSVMWNATSSWGVCVHPPVRGITVPGHGDLKQTDGLLALSGSIVPDYTVSSRKMSSLTQTSHRHSFQWL